MGFFRCLFNLEQHVDEIYSIGRRVTRLERQVSGKKSPSLPKGLNAVVIFLAISFALIIGGLVDDISHHGIEAIYDFLAYILPAAAAVAAGLGVFWEKKAINYFWWSAILLVCGFLFYLISKGVSSTFLLITLVAMPITLICSLLYDIYHRGNKLDSVDRFSRFFLPAIVTFVLLPMLAALSFASFHPRDDARCQITLNKPIDISIVSVPKNGTVNHREGSSERLVLDSSSVIEISPCDYAIKAK